MKNSPWSDPDPFFGESPTLDPRERMARHTGLGLFLAFLTLYGICLPREFIAGSDASYSLWGITLSAGPPPGSPLYILGVSAANSVLGFLPPATAVHFFSAICGAGAVALLFGFSREVTRGRIAAPALASALVGAHCVPWSLSLTCRPAALAWPLLIGELWMLWRFATRGVETQRIPARRSLLLASLLAGLLFSVSPLGVIGLILLVALVLYRGRELMKRPRLWWLGLALFLAGLGPWLFYIARIQLPASSATALYPTQTALIWDYIISARVWDGIWSSIVGEAVMTVGFRYALAQIALGFLGIGLLPILLGMSASKRGRPRGAHPSLVQDDPATARAFLAMQYARRNEQGKAFLAVGGILLLSVGLMLAGGVFASLVLALGVAPGLLIASRHRVVASIMAGWAAACLLAMGGVIEADAATFALLPLLALSAPMIARGIAAMEIRRRTVVQAAMAVLILAQIAVFGRWTESEANLIDMKQTRTNPASGRYGVDWRVIWNDRRCRFPGNADREKNLRDLERVLWSEFNQPTLVVCSDEQLVLLLMRQNIEGRFHGYFFVPNTPHRLMVRSPIHREIEEFQGTANLIRAIWNRPWAVMVLGDREGPPDNLREATPNGGVYVPVEQEIVLGGAPQTVWRLTPRSKLPPLS